jgi:hypothetical protein
MPTRWLVLGIVAAVAVLFEVAGWAGMGLPGGLLMAGFTLFLVGVGATVAGRARWAFIAGRRVGAAVALAGLAGLVAGGVTAPRTADSAADAQAPVSTAPVSTAPVSTAPVSPAPVSTSAAGTTTPPPRTTTAPAVSSSPSRGSALAALALVPVKGRGPQTGYTRDAFGPAWSDTDHNGCDTRNDILARDLTGTTFRAGTHDCVVATGVLADPYSGRLLRFTRGQTTSSAVQIDHVVALSDAWQKGARTWDSARRTAFANDPLELLAVDGSLNMQKGDGDAATWLPPNRSYRCAYVARQVAVKLRYGLWMTQAEKNAIAAILTACPHQPLPTGGAAPPPTPRPAPVHAPAPAPSPAPADVYYANCSAARAAGAAPLLAGQRGYRRALDRDGDGVACEN